MPPGDADHERRVAPSDFSGWAARDPWALLLWAHCCPEPQLVQQPRGSLLSRLMADGASVVTTWGRGNIPRVTLWPSHHILQLVSPQVLRSMPVLLTGGANPPLTSRLQRRPTKHLLSLMV